jgi:hypothetical protein
MKTILKRRKFKEEMKRVYCRVDCKRQEARQQFDKKHQDVCNRQDHVIHWLDIVYIDRQNPLLCKLVKELEQKDPCINKVKAKQNTVWLKETCFLCLCWTSKCCVVCGGQNKRQTLCKTKKTEIHNELSFSLTKHTINLVTHTHTHFYYSSSTSSS